MLMKMDDKDRNKGHKPRKWLCVMAVLVLLAAAVGCKPKPYDDKGDWDFNAEYDKAKAAKALEKQKAPKGTPMDIVLDSVAVTEPRIIKMIDYHVIPFFREEGLILDDYVVEIVTSKDQAGYSVYFSVGQRNWLELFNVIGYFRKDNIVFIVEGNGSGYPFPKAKGSSLKMEYISPPKFYISDRIIAEWSYIFTKEEVYYYSESEKF